jgi:hypothetical protein
MKPPINVDIGFGAKAEIKAEVPSSSVGRLVDAITDIFRPFSEARGLRADQIRMQRAEVAVEIAKLARAAIEAEGLDAKPVPNKVLIPFIEKASNEDLSDEFMVGRWADLLVSASQKEGLPPLYVQILSEIDGRQAKALLDLMINEYRDWYRAYRIFQDSFITMDVSACRVDWQRLIAHRSFKSWKEAYQVVVDYFNRPGTYLYHVGEREFHLARYNYLIDLGTTYSSGLERELEICCAVGLMKREEIELSYHIGKRRYFLDVIYFRLTGIGIEFIQACARDTAKLLADYQKQADIEYGTIAEYKDRLSDARRKARYEKFNDITGTYNRDNRT